MGKEESQVQAKIKAKMEAANWDCHVTSQDIPVRGQAAGITDLI